ncbi:MAG TPA: hypothetical protein PK629_10630 [Oscillospiraceae bacterium]|nr:hypothetical protein [Oscillospiraceae bacterium]HPF55941.1 hypothetical protein [Clostridiales bacterium]HPK36158.1 hypothetical protein [Oscillospiraceae bacterium]HPR76536.1 hypothetical protein [Oscillospiraceae bacterium]
MELRTLYKDGNYYKGNTHTHTTISDGGGSPSEVVKAYQNAGYSFLTLTDHQIYGFDIAFNSKDFLILPGTELDTMVNGIHHIVAVGHPDRTKYQHEFRFDRERIRSLTPQQVIDEVNAHGNLAILCHPHWSKVDYATVKPLRGLFAMEIMNYACQMMWHCGNAEFFYDHFLWDKNNMMCVAADDLHNMERDMFGGFITVKCEKLTYDALFDAMEKGSFFASYSRLGRTAPTIRDFYIRDGGVFFDCSPCESVYFKSNGSWKSFYDKNGGYYTHAEWELHPGCEYVQAVCVDKEGNISWTQPIIIQ